MPDREPGFLQRTAIVVGQGSCARLAGSAEHLGIRRSAVLIDANLADTEVAEAVLAQLGSAALVRMPGGEPTVGSIRGVADELAAAEVDGVVAVGGGSTMDTGKIARGFLAARGAERLQDIPSTIEPAPVPLIAMPTTAGTGAEIGAGAIVFDPAVEDKVLFRRSQLAADVAIADGDLTLGLPAVLTAVTGLDAFAQALMAYLPAGPDSISGQNALRAMQLIAASLPGAVEAGEDRTIRGRMMLGSVLSALAMYNAPPVYAGEHVFAEPVGTALRINHGHAVAALLPGTIEFNLDHCQQRFAELARALGFVAETARDDESATAFATAVRDLVHDVGVGPLHAPDGEPDLDALAARCERHEAYSLNPRPLERRDAVAVLRGAFDGTFSVRYTDREVANHG